MPLDATKLVRLLNDHEPNMPGFYLEGLIIEVLNTLGRAHGYGAVAQMAQWIREVQCDRNPEPFAEFKEKRFKQMNRKLPDDWNELIYEAKKW